MGAWLLIVADSILTTCVVVIVGAKVSFVSSFNGILAVSTAINGNHQRQTKVDIQQKLLEQSFLLLLVLLTIQLHFF